MIDASSRSAKPGMSDLATSVLMRSEDSAGLVGMVVNSVPAGWGGPPLHLHDFDEAFYVLAGELTFQLGEQRRTAGSGALVFAPRGSCHTLANHGRTDARYLLTVTPGGFERCLDPPERAAARYPETIVVGSPIDPAAPAGAPVATPDGDVRVLLRREDADGTVEMMDSRVPAGFGGVFRKHRSAAALYVVEGELVLRLDGERRTVRAGEAAFAPSDMPYAFMNRSGKPARILLAALRPPAARATVPCDLGRTHRSA